MRRPRRTIVLGTSLFACLHGGTPCLLRSCTAKGRACLRSGRTQTLARRDAVPPTCLQTYTIFLKFSDFKGRVSRKAAKNAKKTVEHFFRAGPNPTYTTPAADACLRVHASDARVPFKTIHSPPFGGRGLGVGLCPISSRPPPCRRPPFRPRLWPQAPCTRHWPRACCPYPAHTTCTGRHWPHPC